MHPTSVAGNIGGMHTGGLLRVRRSWADPAWNPKRDVARRQVCARPPSHGQSQLHARLPDSYGETIEAEYQARTVLLRQSLPRDCWTPCWSRASGVNFTTESS